METEDDQRIAILLKYYWKEQEKLYKEPEPPTPRMNTEDPAHKQNIEQMKRELGIH